MLESSGLTRSFLPMKGERDGEHSSTSLMNILKVSVLLRETIWDRVEAAARVGRGAKPYGGRRRQIRHQSGK